jgi:hypothetical protein
MARQTCIGIRCLLLLALAPARAYPGVSINLTTDIHAVEITQPGGVFTLNKDVVIPVHVTGGDLVEGVDWYMQVAQGNTTGTAAGPHFLAMNLLDIPAGSGPGLPIFATVSNSGNNTWIQYQSLYDGTTTPEGVKAAGSGVLGYVTLNTGNQIGTYALNMKDLEGDLAGLDTSFYGTTVAITNGQISVVPEPGAGVGLLGLAGTGGIGWWYWRRRSRTPNFDE